MIQVKNVDKYFGHQKIISNISLKFELNKRNIYAIIGPNGAGKTTVMKMVSGILIPNSGTIECAANVQYAKWARENIAYVSSDQRGLYYKNSVYDNVLYYGVLKGIESKKIKNNIKQFSKALQIASLLYCRVDQLSTGQKKKAQLLCALCSNTMLIILDEPSSGLDIDSSINLQNLLKKIVGMASATVIIVSHDINFISELANKYYFIFKGENYFEFNDPMTNSAINEKYQEIKNGIR